MNILYVENHPVFSATVIRQFLSQHSVVVVPSLTAAREAIANYAFDLALVDYDLDDGKGDEFVRETVQCGRKIVVIGVSSHDEGNAALLRAGAVTTCNKMHFERIQEVIDSATPGTSAAAAGHSLLWWVIPGVLAGMPMPYIHPERRMVAGGSLNDYPDELPELYAAGVRAIVSLLNLRSDKPVYESAGFEFLCLPIPDGCPPTLEQADAFVQFVQDQRRAGKPVAAHCEAGIGRTGTMLAVYLISQGANAGAAVIRIRAVEKAAIETQRQLRFLEEYAAHIMNRKEC